MRMLVGLDVFGQKAFNHHTLNILQATKTSLIIAKC